MRNVVEIFNYKMRILIAHSKMRVVFFSHSQFTEIKALEVKNILFPFNRQLFDSLLKNLSLQCTQMGCPKRCIR